jgi:tRNA threonylcarbamoyladenosine biosynthesis protein TsaB
LTTFALDTATPSPALAVVAGGEVIAELSLEPTPAGGRRVLECVHQMMTEADLSLDSVDRIVVGVGPGGFTGLRIGISTAMGLAQALGVPAVGASSLEALALSAGEHAPTGALVAPVIDARRREVFGALYRATGSFGLDELVAPGAFVPKDFAAAVLQASGGAAVYAAGDGCHALAPHLEAPCTALGVDSPGHRIRAAHLVHRVDSGAGLAVVPQYLRLPDAEVNRLRAEAVAVQRPAA